MTTPITSLSQWQNTINSTPVVIADFYADWCGPCKMIAPTFESLASKHAKPGRVVFAKINTDQCQEVSRDCDVKAMPTFIIYTNGIKRETIQGANPPQLMAAVTKYVKLSGAASFSSPGRTLGGSASSGSTSGAGGLFGGLFSSSAPAAGAGAGATSSAANRPRPRTAATTSSSAPTLDFNRFVERLITFFGLYFVSLFSLDPFMAAQNSQFNIQNPTAPINIPSAPLRTASGGGSSGTKAGGTASGRSAPQQRATFKTLADLN